MLAAKRASLPEIGRPTAAATRMSARTCMLGAQHPPYACGTSYGTILCVFGVGGTGGPTDDIGGASAETAASLFPVGGARLLRRKKRAARTMSAKPPTPPTTPPTIAPVLFELLVAAPEETLVALCVALELDAPVDDVAAEVDVEFTRSVALQCVKVLLFEDVWFKVA